MSFDYAMLHSSALRVVDELASHPLYIAKSDEADYFRNSFARVVVAIRTLSFDAIGNPEERDVIGDLDFFATEGFKALMARAMTPDPATETLVAGVTALNGSTAGDKPAVIERLPTELTDEQIKTIEGHWDEGVAKGWHRIPQLTGNAGPPFFFRCLDRRRVMDDFHEELDRGC